MQGVRYDAIGQRIRGRQHSDARELLEGEDAPNFLQVLVRQALAVGGDSEKAAN